jgi:hypothetical protein
MEKMSVQEADISSVSHPGTASVWREITEVIQDTSNKALLRRIEFLLANENVLAEAARLSHRHQLGFFKYVLMADLSGRCLRVHLWDSSANSIHEDIHSHCAQFRSRVVFGQLSENTFELVPGTSYTRFRYRFDQSLGHSVAEPDGRTGITLKDSRVFYAGDTYDKDSTDLHNVIKVEPGTLTVSAWGLRQYEAIVLKMPGACPEDCVAHLGIPVAEFRVALHQIKERITA